MCCCTRYAHCVSADLYHIEFERSENISNLLQGKYIEPSKATAYRQNQNSFCGHRSSACQEKGREILAISRPFPVGRYIQFHTALPQAPRCECFLVPVVGVEPTRYRYHWILSPARLPIPSYRRMTNGIISYSE